MEKLDDIDSLIYKLNASLNLSGKNQDLILKTLKSAATMHLHRIQMNDIIEVFSESVLNPHLLIVIQACSILIHHSNHSHEWLKIRKQCKNSIQFLQDVWRINEMPEAVPEHVLTEIENILPKDNETINKVLSCSRVAFGLYNWVIIQLKITQILNSNKKSEIAASKRLKAKQIFIQLYLHSCKNTVKTIK